MVSTPRRVTSPLTVHNQLFRWCLITALATASALCWSESATGTSASSNESNLPSGWLLAKYDSNGDRIISADEISYKRQNVYQRMDLDTDGVVSLEEYQQLDSRKREVILQARFARLDLNDDGDLSAQEYSSYLGSFDRLDSNGDGRLTKEELAAEQAAEAVALVKETEETHCLFWFCFREDF